MRNLTRNETVGVVTLLCGITLLTGWTVLRKAFAAASNSGIILHETFQQAPAAPLPVRPPSEMPAYSGVTRAPSNELVVHVAGAVKKPGLVHLPPGARNDDALKAAGGVTKEANTDAINLAARAEDGAQLYIPTKAEKPSGGAEPTVSASASGGKKSANKSASAGKKGDKSGKTEKLSAPGQGTVNINTASAEELQKLPGIGPSMAERILAFRKENGKFHSPDDLLQVSGIGEKKFARLKPFVRVK